MCLMNPQQAARFLAGGGSSKKSSSDGKPGKKALG